MEVKEIIEKKKELESQIQGLVNNFYKETDVPIEEIKVESLKNQEITALITVSEQSRRMIESVLSKSNLKIRSTNRNTKNNGQVHTILHN